MGEPLRLVVFDWDGTLVDSQRAIVEAMRSTFASHGLPPPRDEAVRQIIGLSLTEAIATLTPTLDPEAHEQLTDTYRSQYSAAVRGEEAAEAVFPGIVESLAKLESAGYLLGVATGKSRRGLMASLERHRLASHFATLQSSDSGPGKPHPDMLLRALADVGVRPQHACMVGDTVFDIAMARAAGVGAVGVAWGYHPAANLRRAGAAGVAAHPAELVALVDRVVRAIPADRRAGARR